MTGRRWLRSASPAVLAVAALTAASCGGVSTQGGSTPTSCPPGGCSLGSAPLAPVADYRTAVNVALRDHLRVWIEADMVKRWEEGRASFQAAVRRVAYLANRPGAPRHAGTGRCRTGSCGSC